MEWLLLARGVSLDLLTEKSDTRIMPDEIRRYGYGKALRPDAAALAIRIRVEPDAFYADFYRATLRDPEFRRYVIVDKNSLSLWYPEYRLFRRPSCPTILFQNPAPTCNNMPAIP